MAFTEFCCRSGGSNMNAGSVDGSSTEPATTALVTYTGGDWDSGTDVYTAPVGADMTEAQAGRFASLYVDGDTAPTTNQYLVARITAVNSGARTITLSTTARTLLGTEVTTGTGNRSLRIGGAWAGPSGTSSFPFSMTISALQNASGYPVRANIKNDQTYSMTAGLSIAAQTSGLLTIQGYSSSYGDLSKATIQGPATGASFALVTASNYVNLVDLIITRNGDSGTQPGLNATALYYGQINRVVVHTVRGYGIASVSPIIECEAYSCGGGGASYGIWVISAAAHACISHDNTGIGFVLSTTSVVSGCIADSNSTDGFQIDNIPYGIVMIDCDAYNNGSDGLDLSRSVPVLFIRNCNFVKNGGYGIRVPASYYKYGVIQNCGFGSGTQANTSGNIQSQSGSSFVESGTVIYASDVTPWVDPANGDFRINLAAAKGAGRGAFTQTAASYSGTVGYPDIGAAQHQDSGGGGARMVNVRGGADQ